MSPGIRLLVVVVVFRILKGVTHFLRLPGINGNL